MTVLSDLDLVIVYASDHYSATIMSYTNCMSEFALSALDCIPSSEIVLMPASSAEIDKRLEAVIIIMSLILFKLELFHFFLSADCLCMVRKKYKNNRM